MLDSFSSASVHCLTRMVSPFSAFSSAVTSTCVLAMRMISSHLTLSFVRFVVDRPDVEVTLEGMEGLFHSSYHIIKSPDNSFFFLIKAGDQDMFSMELLSSVNLLAVFLPRDGYHLLILAFSLVGEVNGEVFSDGAVFLVQFADTLVDGPRSSRRSRLCRPPQNLRLQGCPSEGNHAQPQLCLGKP